MSRIVLVTDAWAPQVNGVVRSLAALIAELRAMGHAVAVIEPGGFRTVPLPGYPEIRLALTGRRAVGARIADARADHVHIATEGPLGWAARGWCRARGVAFTTAWHTRFPDYVAARLPLPRAWVEGRAHAVLRGFHNAGAGCMVATPTLARELATRGVRAPLLWPRGVDHALFRPDAAQGPDPFAGLPRPVFLSVGRVAVEKNLPAFLGLDLPGTKVVVGDGPARPALSRAFPQAHFIGPRAGADLAAHYAAADVLAFPSRTDTFGNVMLEALACGTPVAGFPVPGPLDVIGDSGAGCVDPDLRRAALAALDIAPETCLRHAARFSWAESARRFLGNLAPPRAAGRIGAPRPALSQNRNTSVMRM